MHVCVLAMLLVYKSFFIILKVGLCSPLAMLDGSRFSCHATIIEHDMKLMSIAKK